GRAKFQYVNWFPGVHVIEARATLDGATYSDRSRVTWFNSCASTAALQGAPDADTKLEAMRSFRDSKLAKSNRGRSYSQLYYTHSGELVRMMMFSPMMAVRSQEMIERYLPVMRDLTEGRDVVLTEGDLEEIDGFLGYIGTNASSQLKDTIANLRDDLRNVDVHREFGVTIANGPMQNIRSQTRLQRMNRVGGFMILGGSVIVLGTLMRRRPRRSLKASRSTFCLVLAVLITAPNFSSHSRETLNSRSMLTERDLKSPSTVAQVMGPASFEANQGQADPAIKFISRGSNYSMFLGTAEASFVFPRLDRSNTQGSRAFPAANPLRIKMIASNPDVGIRGDHERPGGTNYFIGDDKAKWRSGVPTFEKVRYDDLYRGVDLVYYGSGEGLEYDFIVAPEADPSTIRFSIEGSDRVIVGDNGDLIIDTPNGELHQHRPVAYQETSGERSSIPARYDIKKADSFAGSSLPIISFEIGDYDHARPLIIDPVLEFSSYFGGTGDDQGTSMAVDAAGNIYVVGITDSTDLLTNNAAQPVFGGVQDTFVAKLDPTGTRILYLTYLGGSDLDGANGLTIDSAGNAYITGYTRSRNFPVLNPLQPANRGQFNSFVTKLGPTGNMVYSTYLGGTAGDAGSGIVVDAAGNAYVAGITTSPNFPTSNPVQPTLRGAGDLYVAKLNAAGNQLLYSTYLGGSMDDASTSIALDSSGNVYVAGATLSPDFRTANAAQQSHGGGIFDAFVLKLNSLGNQLVYSTYVGGNGGDRAFRITADPAGNAYVIGDTRSPNLTTTGPLQRTLAGGSDAFVAKFGPNGSLLYSTYLGGSGIDSGTAIALDQSGAAFVTGFTSSPNFPTVSAVQPALSNGSIDAFVAKITPSGSALEYSTYLGGSGT
ncbi:MAG TPA: SBBP repeat-containing protein, partial [Blastocatellia bacterium]|nr:SBBP repeat-containing protein [Blastocatellia bacterium]